MNGTAVRVGADGLEHAVARLADLQYGNVSRGQLNDLGLSDSAVDRRIRRKLLRPRHRGVFGLGHVNRSARSRDMAALLACPERSVLSHESAAAFWGFKPDRAGQRVTVTVSHAVRRAGIQPHLITLDDRDFVVRHFTPVTHPAPTVVHLAANESLRDLERLVNEVQVLELATEEQLVAALARTPGRRGTAALAAILGLEEHSVQATELERRLHELLSGSGLPMPTRQRQVGKYRVDFIYERERLVVEADGYRFHRTRSRFESDRDRDADLLIDGWRVLRVTWRQLTREPLKVVARVARLVERGRRAA